MFQQLEIFIFSVFLHYFLSDPIITQLCFAFLLSSRLQAEASATLLDPPLRQDHAVQKSHGWSLQTQHFTCLCVCIRLSSVHVYTCTTCMYTPVQCACVHVYTCPVCMYTPVQCACVHVYTCTVCMCTVHLYSVHVYTCTVCMYTPVQWFSVYR